MSIKKRLLERKKRSRSVIKGNLYGRIESKYVSIGHNSKACHCYSIDSQFDVSGLPYYQSVFNILPHFPGELSFITYSSNLYAPSVAPSCIQFINRHKMYSRWTLKWMYLNSMAIFYEDYSIMILLEIDIKQLPLLYRTL